MDFYSLIKPVTLSEDPLEAEDGSLYYNNVTLTYRLKTDGVWSDLVHYNNLKTLIAPEIFFAGTPSIASLNFVLQGEYFSENILYVLTASSCNIIIPSDESAPIHAGARITIVRASDGDISISPQEGIELRAPSDVYLTTKWDTVVLNKIFSNTWLLEGDFRDLY